MIAARFISRLRPWLEQSLLSLDAARAWRSSVAFTATWVVCLWTSHPAVAVFAATAAQNLAMQDLRGDYRARLAILLAMSVVLMGSVLAGRLTGNHLASATLMVGALALLGSAWRHLSADYGPNLAIVSALLFLFALSQPGNWPAGLLTMSWVALGCAAGILCQLAGWFVRPQHAVRHAVAESWVAVSDLITAMRTETNEGQPCTSELAGKEGALRTTVDATLHTLAEATTQRRQRFFQHLDDATQVAARLATRVSALHTALEGIRSGPEFAPVAPTLDVLLHALANAARSAALALITHRPEQFLALEVRLRRCQNLARILDTRLAATGPAAGPARQMLAQVSELLPVVRTTIQETVDHGAPHATFALRLPELGGLSLKSLSAWVNPAPQLDPVLIRYALRIALLMMLAVAVYKWYSIPRGYWIAFTAVIVLQPDYGSTRQKAGQRIAGTLAGCILGSLLICLKIPIPLLVLLTSVMAFFFAYYLKRRYALAVFFVTLMLVTIMDAVEPLSWQFTFARLYATLAGGGMALVAAWLLWPQWEKEQFPKILAPAVRANRAYLAAILTALQTGQPFTGSVIQRKREVERANSLTAASLQRMLGEPANPSALMERAAALTASNQRITRAATVLAVHLNLRQPVSEPGLALLGATIAESLENLARHIASEPCPAGPVPPPPEPRPAPGDATAPLIYGQLAKIVTEIEAMALVNE